MSEIESDGIAVRVRAARERLGWSREALAFHSELSWSAIAQVESGRRTNLRPSTLSQLSRSLGVSIDYLATGSPSGPTMLNHSMFPYRTEDQFRNTMGSFLADGVERSEALLAVTTAANIELLREHLGTDADKVRFVDLRDFYSTPIGALEAIKSFSEAQLAGGASWVRFLGEPRWAGRSDGEVRLWTRYESILNLVFAASPMTIVCPYDERSVAPEILAHAHSTHPHILDERGDSQSLRYTDPRLFALTSDEQAS
jgi:transcriptional regulator with XRE-family HTH domain